MAIVGGIGIFVACLLPVLLLPDLSGGTTDYSILPVQTGQTLAHRTWFAVAPVAAALFVAAIGLAALGRAIRTPLAAGLLMGVAMTQALAFLGYMGSAAASPTDATASIGVGAFLGIGAAIVVGVAGLAMRNAENIGPQAPPSGRV